MIKFFILNSYFINNKYVMLCFKEKNKNKMLLLCAMLQICNNLKILSSRENIEVDFFYHFYVNLRLKINKK